MGCSELEIWICSQISRDQLELMRENLSPPPPQADPVSSWSVGENSTEQCVLNGIYSDRTVGRVGREKHFELQNDPPNAPGIVRALLSNLIIANFLPISITTAN